MSKRTTDRELPQDFIGDVQAYLDGRIETSKFEALESLLEESSEARQVYRSYANMDSNLREVVQNSDGQGPTAVNV